MKASVPWYSSSAKLSGIGSEPNAFGAFGWLAKNCSSFVGFGASGGLPMMASSRSRKSSPVPTGKNFNELVTMSVSTPPDRWYLMAMPWGFAAGEPSATFGIPLPSEKRTVTGIVRPLKSGARLSRAASGDALKLPSTTTPFAWKARNPGCTPFSLFAKSTTCVETGGLSEVAEAAANRSDTHNKHLIMVGYRVQRIGMRRVGLRRHSLYWQDCQV